MNKEAETYEELIRKKRCIDLTKYYDLSIEELDEIYEFLKNNKDAKITGGRDNISLSNGKDIVKVIATKLFTSTIDGLILTNMLLKIIPHYTPSSSGSSWGGSSSNNKEYSN